MWAGRRMVLVVCVLWSSKSLPEPQVFGPLSLPVPYLQPEPLLPSREQAFALPRDWLIGRPPRYEPVKRSMWLSRNKPKRLPKVRLGPYSHAT